MKLIVMTAATAALAFLVEPASAQKNDQEHHQEHHRHQYEQQYLRMAHHEGSTAINVSHRFARHEGGRRMLAAHSLTQQYADGGTASGRAQKRVRANAAASAYALAPGGEAQSGGYGARPSAWCGWEMRHLVSQDPGPAYNLAANWAH
jgi:hypothetical protein